MYYPQSQIQTNLFSNNDLVVLNTKEPYTGYYWSTSNGKFFAGKTPDALQSYIELAQNTDSNSTPGQEPPLSDSPAYIEGNINAYTYAALKKVDTSLVPDIPHYIPAKLTKDDYVNGEFTRYFCKKINESLFIEISPETYEKLISKDPTLLHHLFIPFKLGWVITGDMQKIANENKNIVKLLETNYNLQGLGDYLKHNYTQYVDPTPGIQKVGSKKIYKDSGLEVPLNLPSTYQLGNGKLNKGQQCIGCAFYQQGLCYKWNASIRAEYWCTAWETNPGVNYDTSTNSTPLPLNNPPQSNIYTGPTSNFGY